MHFCTVKSEKEKIIIEGQHVCCFSHTEDLKNLRCFLEHQHQMTSPPSPANYKIEDAKTMELCTVTVCLISTKTQQLNFQNFYYSIVCSYCSVVCLIIKVGQKIIENSNTSYENEIHRICIPSSEDSKGIIVLARKFSKNGQKQENLLLCKLGSTQFY